MTTIVVKAPGRRTLDLIPSSFKATVNSSLLHEQEVAQWHIYYISKSMLNAETCYPEMEKLALPLIFATQKLHPYFMEHNITLPTTFPMK